MEDILPHNQNREQCHINVDKLPHTSTFHISHPIALFVSDLLYVVTWSGFVYVTFLNHAFARRIVGWRATSLPRTDLELVAVEQTLYTRQVALNIRSGPSQ